MATVFGGAVVGGTDKTKSNIIQVTKTKAEPAIKLIKDYISKSSVVGFDESGCYCNGRLDWSWIAQTTYYTLVFRDSFRAGKVLENQFGADVLKNITVVTDLHGRILRFRLQRPPNLFGPYS